MITTSKHSDSRGRANERARTGIESERARAFFQNIHSHIGQWTFGYILSGAGGEKGGSLNAWDLRKEFVGAWEWQCHGSRQRTLLKTPPRHSGLLQNTVIPAVSDSSGFKSLFSKDKNPVCSRCSLNKRSVNKEDYLPMSD